MWAGTGYCFLSFYRTNALRKGGFPPLNGVDETLWLRGILVHELAHCIDLARDFPTLERPGVGTRSVAPSDAPAVQDFYSLNDAANRLSTQVWREAVADLTAIGFWRVTASVHAAELAAALRASRVREADDREHATMCWIDYAARADGPASMGDVFLWADRVRSAAACIPSS